MVMISNIMLAQKDVAYFVNTMCHYKDKEMLVVPFNTGNHWLLLSMSTMYDQVCYCDSSRLTDSKIGDRLTHDYTNILSVLDE
jgi:hypothetical protein